MKISTPRFIEVWKQTGGKPSEVAKILGFSSISAASNRRKSIEKELGVILAASSERSPRNRATKDKNSRRIGIEMKDGLILIGSDMHIWPGPLTTAQRGFLKIAQDLKPDVVIANGDVFDGAKISRHPAGTWDQEKRPNVKQELEACQAYLSQIAAPRRIWTWGNHDARIEYTLAALVPQYEGVPGFALKDHFPEWTFCMAVFVNDNLVVKHRLANGMHAAYNNTVKSGRSMVTGHLHSLKVTPWTDYNGTRYGVDCGTLADPESKQFDYSEEAPSNHRAGFVAITIKDRRPLYPELIQVWDEDHIEFRGKLIRV
jgi:predicted phosphodiesterase